MNEERLEVRAVEPEEDTLALELLKQIQQSSKRWFIAFIIAILMLFVTNTAWLYAWNLPNEEVDSVSTSYDVSQDSGDSGINNYIGSEGDINNGNAKN